MRKEKIEELIDRKILKALVENGSITDIQNELCLRVKNFTKSLRVYYKYLDIDSLTDRDFDKIEPVRIRYSVYYIKWAKKRLVDLEWIRKNKVNIKRNYKNYELFKLVQLKEKLSHENALPF